jgi:hypothetical protein
MFTVRLRPVFAFILLCFAAQPALAVPAPMSDTELMEKSDLVALVRVLSVTCTSITKDEKTGQDLPGYLAKLEIVEVKKGDMKPGEVVLVTWRALPEGIIGGWSVAYYPGEEVWTHLTKRSGGVTYATTWWNAKGTPIKEPETTDLPPGIGQTSAMRGKP